MKIMAPLSVTSDIDRLRQAGADEFYFGFEHSDWTKKFGCFAELNRMSSFGSRANIPFEQVESFVKTIRNSGGKSFITINSPSYSYPEIKFLKGLVEELQEIKPDGLIAGSIEMCAALRRWTRMPVTASTMCGIYNSEILSFYLQLGIRRVILPRDIRLDDLKALIMAFPQVEFECFILRNGCRFSDGNCLSFHSRGYGSLCAWLNKLPVKMRVDGGLSANEMREVQSNHFLYDRVFHHSACGLCEVDTFRALGIASLKIVGRADHPDEIEKDIVLLRRLIDHPGDSHNMVRNECLYGLNCYYPDPGS